MLKKRVICTLIICLTVCSSLWPATSYPDLRPTAALRMEAEDQGPVLLHGNGPAECDRYGARDVWVWESNGKYYMHYDAAGPTGWLTALAESNDLVHWKKQGNVLDLGTSPALDCASASYGTTYQADDGTWHMFYLGTPHVTPAPDRIPSFPYLTMKATAPAPAGPWTKHYDVTPFRPAKGTYYEDTASPGFILKHNDEYLQFFSASRRDEKRIRRTIGIARTKDLNGSWVIDPHPIVPLEEQIENSSIYYEPANQTYFLFTNHVAAGNANGGGEYTDAVWVYWTKDPNYWDARKKAVVLDGANCKWASRCIGLPSVVKHGDKLAVFYDAPKGDSTSHMNRDVGLAWLKLPLQPPIDGLPGVNPAVKTGLDLLAKDGAVLLLPGTATVDGKDVSISTTSTLAFEPATTQSVHNEPLHMPEKIVPAWTIGGNLQITRTTNMIPGPLVPESLHVRAEDGTVLQKGKDYITDDLWGKLAIGPSGRVSTETLVLLDYDYSLLRIDGIDITPKGMAVVVKGTPNLVCPVPPDTTTGALRLANVFRPYGATGVESWQIFFCGSPYTEPTHEQQLEMSKPVRRTLEKLRAGEPVTIVTWGDSVTVGGDTSKPELAYANLFITQLRSRFPAAKITHINASIGGTTTEGRLPAFEEEVISHKPDLVTIEFVNDIGFPVSKLTKYWDEALTRIKQAGSDAIVITPHFTMPAFMGNAYPRGTEMRPDVRWLKLIAQKHDVGLADTSKRWEHLESEGIPYITLLYNGINHPNDYGHSLFVKDLMNLFPQSD